MLLAAAILFAIAAAGGLAMAVIHFRGKPPPLPLAIAHGMFGAAGLIVLLAALGSGSGFAGLGGISFLIFLITALGGFYLISQHLLKRDLPAGIVLIHGAAAVIALLCLLAVVFGHASPQ